MKKALVFAVLTTMFVIIVCMWSKTDLKTYEINQNEVLRIHIRANSNKQEERTADQTAVLFKSDFGERSTALRSMERAGTGLGSCR